MASTWGNTMNQSLENALRMGESQANAAVGSATNGLNAVLSGDGKINNYLNQMGQDASSIRTQANAVNTTAGQVKNTANNLLPYADTLSGYGDTLWTQGNSFINQSNDVFGQAGSLMNMDQNATGLSGEFIKYYNSLSPDRYVAQAASDTQGAYSNAIGQAQRDLSRRGVSASSGAYGALQKQYATALATALAAAKTKARQTGLDMQAAQLDKMVSAAKTMYDMGSTTASIGLESQKAGASAQQAAAGVIQDSGSLLVNAGNLEKSAGDLFGTAAGIAQSQASTYSDYLGLVNSAYKNVASAQQAAASYYLNAAGQEVSANNGRGGNAVGGVTTTSASNTDPWAATGHTSTWWKNSLSSSDFADMAQSIAAQANAQK